MEKKDFSKSYYCLDKQYFANIIDVQRSNIWLTIIRI